jgi:hypothetical protein
MRREPPPYPGQVKTFGGIHLALARIDGMWHGVGYSPERRRFFVYSYGGYFAKDGSGGEATPHVLVRDYADTLRAIGAEWLLEAAAGLSGGPGDDRRIIRAYEAEYGQPPRIASAEEPPPAPEPEPPPRRRPVDLLGVLLVGGWYGIVVLVLLFGLLIVAGALFDYFR